MLHSLRSSSGSALHSGSQHKSLFCSNKRLFIASRSLHFDPNRRHALIVMSGSPDNIELLDTIMVPLKLEDISSRGGVLDHAALSANKRVYLALQGPLASNPPTTETLDALTLCFESSASVRPKLDIVPLFPYLGWTMNKLCTLEIDEIVAAVEDADMLDDFIEQLNDGRQTQQLPPLALTMVQGTRHHNNVQHCDTNARILEEEAKQSAVLQFKNVAVGGTFDRLHAGHRLLLAATALVTQSAIFVGITSDALLANKKNKQLLEPYQQREEAAISYMQTINPSIMVVGGPLTDPKIPPKCATERDFDGLVVSEETIPGAHDINKVRAGLGFHPLVVVVVGLLPSGEASKSKLSSTELRNKEAWTNTAASS